MDKLIERFDALNDGDLMIAEKRGVAWQRDMDKRAKPGEDHRGVNYFDLYEGYRGQSIVAELNAGRANFVDRHVGAEAKVLDVGIGCGDFVSWRPNTLGTDVNPVALNWLDEKGKRAEGLEGFDAYTFWDVLEHVPEPESYFKRIADGAWLFACLPVFSDLNKVRESKHYKPTEHLYYFTPAGFADFMAMYRFRLVEMDGFETSAGRESILSFAFRKDLPDYRDTVAQYKEMHARTYGTSAYLHLNRVAREVLALRPGSIIDFGCGWSDLVAHFWNDGNRRIAKYDPAIPRFATMPQDSFDLAICCDVMEHILPADIERVLREILAKAPRALFTICLKPARARLPDGRNAHVSLFSRSEWQRFVGSVFGQAIIADSDVEDTILVKTW